MTIIFAGVVAALRGTAPPEVERHLAPAQVTHPEHESSTFRYCTNFAVTGSELEASRWIPLLEAIGDSVLVVGDAHTLKVHVHTDDPEAATRLFGPAGEVSHLDVADMHAQVAEREERLGAAAHDGHAGVAAARHRCGALAVASGAGLRRALREPRRAGARRRADDEPVHLRAAGRHPRGARRGGRRAAQQPERRSWPPSAPPSSARRSCRSSRRARSRPASPPPWRSTPTVPPPRTPTRWPPRWRTCAPAAWRPRRATTPKGASRIGDAVGFVDDELVAWGDPQATLRDVLLRLGDGAELVTCIAGDGAPLDADAVVALAPDGVELECEPGGQPSWWWLVSAE